MKTPSYIKRLLARCEWAVETGRLPKGCDPGYTLLLHKRSVYSHADTLRKEAGLLVAWCRRRMAIHARYISQEEADKVAFIHESPKQTSIGDQSAVIVIWDPVLQMVEKHVTSREGKGNAGLTAHQGNEAS